MRLGRPFVKIARLTKGLIAGRAMTKSRGIGRGGWRGGGRPKGSKNKVKVLAELLPRLEQQDWELPLYRLLRRVHDNTLDEKYRDLLAIQIMPFLHPRPRSDQTAKAPFQMSDAELDETMRAQLEHERQVKKGRGHLHLARGPK